MPLHILLQTCLWSVKHFRQYSNQSTEFALSPIPHTTSECSCHLHHLLFFFNESRHILTMCCGLCITLLNLQTVQEFVHNIMKSTQGHSCVIIHLFSTRFNSDIQLINSCRLSSFIRRDTSLAVITQNRFYSFYSVQDYWR